MAGSKVSHYAKPSRYFASALCVTSLALSLTTVSAVNDQAPGDVNGLGGASSNYDIVKVTVPEKLDIINFEVVKPSPGATETNNSHITVLIDARGSGTLTIRDQNGNILWQGTRTETAESTFEVDLNLPSVGEYTLTLTIENSSLVPPADSAELTIVYTSFLPEPPNTGFITGYFYISGYAVPNYVVYLVLIVLLLIFFTWRHFRNKEKRAPILIPIPVPAKRTKPKAKKKTK